MSESSQSVVELRGLKAATMEVLLEFIYTEQVDVTIENVQDLLPAACLLQLKGMNVLFLICVYITTTSTNSTTVLLLGLYKQLQSLNRESNYFLSYLAIIIFCIINFFSV